MLSGERLSGKVPNTPQEHAISQSYPQTPPMEKSSEIKDSATFNRTLML